MEKEELLKELRKQFNLTKEKLKFKATFDEINEVSYIEDMALSQGFVSNQFSRQMINRMIDGPYSWLNDLYGWLYPPPTDLIHLNEGKSLTQEERKEVLEMLELIIHLFRKNKRIAFEGLNPEEEGRFVDELVEFKKTKFLPFMAKYHIKMENLWKK
jgi:hypothetical protein